MSLSSGTLLGPYEILSPIGAGGMGEVYRARDLKLGREVAVKVLPVVLAGDAQYMARFEREAQVLASLSHPNIAAVYGIEQGALVMELVPGDTLAGRIAAGALPLEEALAVARQIAAGLEAAHDRGIVHRDLKPANVKITPDGLVKLLDFGLAKAADEAAPSASNLTISPTLSMAMTQAGTILGTAAYMSPEQARGKPVDRRSDIWSFGVVLYEMLTGQALFASGETVTDIIAAVVTREPDWSALSAATPPHIRRLLERCLRKDVKTRLQAIGEARIAIDEPAQPLMATVAGPSRQGKRPWLAWAVASLAVMAGAAGWWRATRPPELRPLVRMNVEISPDMSIAATTTGGLMALSPDGTRVALSMRGADGRLRLYTRLLHQSQLTALAGTEDGGSPFFSPDGQWIGFAASGKLKKIAVEGGAAITLCEAAALRGASWGDDGNIVLAAAPSGGLSRVSSNGGTPAPLTKVIPPERTHRWPQILPGSQAVLFTSHSGSSNYDEAAIEVVSVKTGQRKTLHRGGFAPHYLPTPDGSGRLLYLHQGALFAAPFDLRRLQTTGAAMPALEQVSSSGNGGGDFAFSSTGTFVYLPGAGHAGNWMIAWIDRSGKKQPLHATPGGYYTPRLSPDGKRLAFTLAGGQGFDVWVKDLERDAASRLTFLKSTNNWPVWTPDGKNIIFKSTDPAGPGLYWVRADGAGEAQRLTDGKRDEYPYSISSDGKRLAFGGLGKGGSPDLFTAAIEGDSAHPKLGEPEVFLSTPAVEALPAFSPDGRWIAYLSSESGVSEIYVRPFPGPGGRWQVSTSGGVFPLWSRDGRELLYRSPGHKIMAVNYTTKGDSFVAGKPYQWSDAAIMDFGTLSTWDIAPDGKRLAALTPELSDDKQKPLTHLTFLLNFADELQRRK